MADGPRASARMSAQSLCVLMQGKVGIDTILALHLPRPEPARHPVRPAGRVRPRPPQHPRHHRRPAQARRLPGRDRGLRRGLHRAHPHHEPPEPRLRPGRQPHRARAGDPHRLRGRPQQPDREKEIRRLEEKIKAGAEYIMTQPVYDPATIGQFLGSIRHLEVPVLIGILPLYSHKNAEFLHNEVPGMTIPDDIRDAEGGGVREAAHAEGVSIAQDALRAAQDVAQGAYIMPPFNKVELAVRVIEGLRSDRRAMRIPSRARPRRADRRRPRRAAASVTGAGRPVRLRIPRPPRGSARRPERARRAGQADHQSRRRRLRGHGGRAAADHPVFARGIDEGQDTAEAREALALDLGLLLDTSDSMLKELKLSQEAASRFLEAIPRARRAVHDLLRRGHPGVAVRQREPAGPLRPHPRRERRRQHRPLRRHRGVPRAGAGRQRPQGAGAVHRRRGHP